MTKLEKTIALISLVVTSVFILQFSFGSLMNTFVVFENLILEFISLIGAVGLLIIYISIPLLILRFIWRFINS